VASNFSRKVFPKGVSTEY